MIGWIRFTLQCQLSYEKWSRIDVRSIRVCLIFTLDKTSICLGSIAGYVIQVIERMEFEASVRLPTMAK